MRPTDGVARRRSLRSFDTQRTSAEDELFRKKRRITESGSDMEAQPEPIIRLTRSSSKLLHSDAVIEGGSKEEYSSGPVNSSLSPSPDKHVPSASAERFKRRRSLGYKQSSERNDSTPDDSTHMAPTVDSSTSSDTAPRKEPYILRRLRPRNIDPTSSSVHEQYKSTSHLSAVEREEVQADSSTDVKYQGTGSKVLEKRENRSRADDSEEDDDQHGTESDARRYPIRNRRHTDVYQVEYPQNNHHNYRNWLAGTGCEQGRRRRRHRSRGYRDGHHSDSSTSLSADSDSGTFIPERSQHVAASPAFRPSHSSWHPTTWTGDDALAQPTDENEARFTRWCTQNILDSRADIVPINMKRTDPTVKAVLGDRLLTDVEPMTIDGSIGFDHIGGHDQHIAALKESILLPLMYPEVFSRFAVDPPRGVLFTGPPGTGKTLLARALANECTRMASLASGNGDSTIKRPIAFFMRKGADCLTKWVGESELQLRLLFDQAYRMRPSIIFFDEIDGLAPVRSPNQDQIYSSIVSTLLSLMDGLDHRAEVVIIGATNRPDAIDPALRRPGRFDREFVFSLPSESVRQRILEVHTSKWDPKPNPELLKQIASTTANFSGADLKALATEACLHCLRRQYPQIYQSRVRLALEYKYLTVSRCDWIRALQVVRPSNARSDASACSSSLPPGVNALAATIRSPLSENLSELLKPTLEALTQLLVSALVDPPSATRSNMSPVNGSSRSPIITNGVLSSPKVLITGDVPECLINALWHQFESVQVYTINLANTFAFPMSGGMCPEAALSQIISATKRALNTTPQLCTSSNPLEMVQGVVLYIPKLDVLLERLPKSTGLYLMERLQELVNQLLSDDVALSIPKESTIYSELARISPQHSRRLVLVASMQRFISNRTQKSNHDNHVSPLIDPLSRQIHRSPDIAEKICSTGQPNKTGSSEKLLNGSGHKRHRPSTPPRLHANLRPCPGTMMPSFHLGAQPPAISSVVGTLSSERKSKSKPTLTPPSLVRFNHVEELSSEPSSSSFSGDADDADLEEFPRLSPSNINSCKTSHHRGHRRQCKLIWRLFSQSSSLHVHVKTPGKSARESFFSAVLTSWPRLDLSKYSSGLNEDLIDPNADRPPTPPPAANELTKPSVPTPVQLTPLKLLELEREEAQLFRRLRQALRRVVAHLARHRRFAVFSRPVQLDEAPDYYQVIKNPMDLGSIRDKIDAHQYTCAEDFMKDVEQIYYNALEYNPINVPRSREIRARASEFWDEACLKIDEELHPPDLNDRCKAAAKARSERAESGHKRSDRPVTPANVTVAQSPSGSNPAPKTAQTPNKALPMPQGDRYSRRLHGEPPILETQDIQVLEAISGRRNTSMSTSIHSSESDQIRAKLGLSGSKVDMDKSSSSKQSPPLVTERQDDPLGITASPDISVTELASTRNRSSTPTLVTTSPAPPNITPTATPLESDGGSPLLSISSIHCPSPPPSQAPVGYYGLDSGALQAFHQHVVQVTENWSVDQLLRLHVNLAHTVLQQCKLLADRSGLLSHLDRILELHVKENLVDRQI
ncbi:unnamed protein product [Calicophoron daubneyi]|uniref:Bromo domain-containing protein n=1 Tax=Calicophoron daubneyi TaxID=300641 RepID=A0AAV2TVN2_CALDB